MDIEIAELTDEMQVEETDVLIPNRYHQGPSTSVGGKEKKSNVLAGENGRFGRFSGLRLTCER